MCFLSKKLLLVERVEAMPLLKHYLTTNANFRCIVINCVIGCAIELLKFYVLINLCNYKEIVIVHIYILLQVGESAYGANIYLGLICTVHSLTPNQGRVSTEKI